MRSFNEIKIRVVAAGGTIVDSNPDDGCLVAFDRFGLHVVASWGGGWDHVSISVAGSRKTPTWDQMCGILDVFAQPTETWVQYRPSTENYINDHPGCLHWWRPQNEVVPTPPLCFV